MTCHSRYLSGGSADTTNANAIFHNRHFAGGNGTRTPVCTTCHVAHGTNAVMTPGGNSASVPYPGGGHCPCGRQPPPQGQQPRHLPDVPRPDRHPHYGEYRRDAPVAIHPLIGLFLVAVRRGPATTPARRDLLRVALSDSKPGDPEGRKAAAMTHRRTLQHHAGPLFGALLVLVMAALRVHARSSRGSGAVDPTPAPTLDPTPTPTPDPTPTPIRRHADADPSPSARSDATPSPDPSPSADPIAIAVARSLAHADPTPVAKPVAQSPSAARSP